MVNGIVMVVIITHLQKWHGNHPVAVALGSWAPMPEFSSTTPHSAIITITMISDILDEEWMMAWWCKKRILLEPCWGWLHSTTVEHDLVPVGLWFPWPLFLWAGTRSLVAGEWPSTWHIPIPPPQLLLLWRWCDLDHIWCLYKGVSLWRCGW